MSTYGPNSPSTGVSTDRGALYSPWSTPANVTASDNNRATSTIGTVPTDYLDVTGFGLSVAADDVVVGITVEIERSEASVFNNIVDETVMLLDAGSPVGDNKAATGTEWPTTDAYASYGGSADVWGYALWTPAKLNASNFGIRIAASGVTDGQARVDHVRVTVTTRLGLTMAETLALAETLAMKFGKSLTETMTIVDALALATGRTITDPVALADAVSVLLVHTVSVSEALAILDAIAMKTGKVIAETLNLTETVQLIIKALAPRYNRWAPRPLITIQIGATTKRYSTETVYVPASGIGVGEYGEMELGVE